VKWSKILDLETLILSLYQIKVCRGTKRVKRAAIILNIRERRAARLAIFRTRTCLVQVNTQHRKGSFTFNKLIIFRAYGGISNINYNPWGGQSISTKNKRSYVTSDKKPRKRIKIKDKHMRKINQSTPNIIVQPGYNYFSNSYFSFIFLIFTYLLSC
jgi:hypothetical protein